MKVSLSAVAYLYTFPNYSEKDIALCNILNHAYVFVYMCVVYNLPIIGKPALITYLQKL